MTEITESKHLVVDFTFDFSISISFSLGFSFGHTMPNHFNTGKNGESGSLCTSFPALNQYWG